MIGATVNLGLVGLGYWGPNLLRVLGDMPDVDIAWLCDRDEDRLAQFARRRPTAACTTEYEDLLEDPGVDAICIATPIGTHFELARRALAAGKHVFVEKPLAGSSIEADTLLAEADGLGRVVMCGHTFLYSPPVRAVKAMLDRDELGTLFFISSSRVNLGLHQRDVSVIWDLGPHDFSILLYWLGELPCSVRAVGRDSIVPGIADVAFITLTFPSGLVANVELSWLAPSKLRRTVIVGSQKMVVYDDASPEPVRVFDSGVNLREPETFGEFRLTYRTGDIVSPRIDAAEPLAIELRDFCNAINKSIQPRSSSGLGVEVVRMMEAVDRSLSSAGARVSVDANALSPAVA